MLTFLRLYSICGNLRGSVTHWYSTALQFQQMIYFIRLFRHPVSAEGYDGLVLLPVDPQVIRSSAVGTMGRRGSAAVFLSVFYQISYGI